MIYMENMADTQNDDALALLLKALLDEKKGLDIVLMDLRGKATFADIFLMATGTSRTHVVSLAEEVDRFFHERHIQVLGVAGLPEANWVLVDAGNIVVHLFQQETRVFYDLEKLWSSPDLPDRLGKPAEARVS